MKKETVLLVVVALIIGLLVGIIVSKGGKGPMVASGGAPSAPVDYQQNITMLESLVAREPANRNAWVQLGNNYFQSDQPIKSIEAYGKALELDPKDPNVLTDQGVMFRRLGWYDRAIENFNKSQEIDPYHPQSLFNLGVVYRYDLEDFPKAYEAWSRYVQLHPNTPASQQLQPELQALRSLQGLHGGQ